MSVVEEDGSVASGMEVDEGQHVFERTLKPDAVFARSKELTVAFHAHLPAEVKHVLRNAGV